MKQILLTLDGSEFSEAAIKPAAELAEALGARVHVLEVVRPPMMSATLLETYGVPEIAAAQASEIWETETGEARRYTYEVMQRLGGKVVAAARFSSDAAEEITEYAVRNAIDYILMATHGRTGLGRLVHGSVAAGVVHAGVAPVLLVRPTAFDTQINSQIDGRTGAAVAR